MASKIKKFMYMGRYIPVDGQGMSAGFNTAVGEFGAASEEFIAQNPLGVVYPVFRGVLGIAVFDDASDLHVGEREGFLPGI